MNVNKSPGCSPFRLCSDEREVNEVQGKTMVETGLMPIWPLDFIVCGFRANFCLSEARHGVL